MYTKQNGFSVVHILLVFILLGIIGGTGWYVMNKNSNVLKKTPHENATMPATNLSSTENKLGAQQAKPLVDYKEIPELGIKIRLTNQTRDLTVKLYSQSSAVFSLQSFIDATSGADVVTGSDGSSSCLDVVSVALYKPDQRGELENDPIQNYKFDTDGKPFDGQWLVQLADKRYARFNTYHAPCIIGGSNSDELRGRESDVKGILLNSLPTNIVSL